MRYAEDLIVKAETFCEEKGLSEEKLARTVAGDSRFFKRIRSGRTFTVKMLEKFEDHFKKNS